MASRATLETVEKNRAMCHFCADRLALALVVLSASSGSLLHEDR
jgi:hypothetical protein